MTPVNPLTPYRCWTCRQRFWMPWPWPRLLRGLTVWAILGLVLVRAALHYRTQVREIQHLLDEEYHGRLPPQ